MATFVNLYYVAEEQKIVQRKKNVLLYQESR